FATCGPDDPGTMWAESLTAAASSRWSPRNRSDRNVIAAAPLVSCSYSGQLARNYAEILLECLSTSSLRSISQPVLNQADDRGHVLVENADVRPRRNIAPGNGRTSAGPPELPLPRAE